MKKSLLLFGGLTFLSLSTWAQPSLTAAGINPVIGDQPVMKSTNYVSPGTSGANQTWNLSTMTVTATNTYVAVNPSSTANGSSFPNSNVAFTVGTTADEYLKTSTASLQFYGVFGNGVVMAYNDPEDWLHYPFNYTNTFTDTWGSTFVSNGVTFYRRGTTTVTADGYGTLTLPNGTFSNVMRVHFVQTYQDSANLGGPFIIPYSNDEYMWYLANNHLPIATVSSLITNGGSPSQTGSYLNNIVTGIAKYDRAVTSMSLFPNPASSHTNLDFSLTRNQQIEIKLFNSIGAQVNETIIMQGLQGDNQYKLEVANFPEGIYFAQILTEGTLSSTCRFVISR